MPIDLLNKEAHSELRVRQISDFSPLATINYLPLVVHEFAHACTDFPIVFLKSEETGQFRPVALFGPANGGNVFVRDGKWIGQYMPAIVRQAPFKLAPNEQNPDVVAVAIDTDSELLSNSEGERLFDETGAESSVLEERKKALLTYAEHAQVTTAFVSMLVKEELLKQQNMTMTADGKTEVFGGIYVIDEQKLNSLPQETYLDMRDRGLIGVVYAHLLSLNQILRLAMLAQEAGQEAAA